MNPEQRKAEIEKLKRQYGNLSGDDLREMRDVEELSVLRKNRKAYIDRLGSSIQGGGKAPAKAMSADDIQAMISKYEQTVALQRQMEFEARMQQYDVKLAFSRTIIPQTRGASKNLVFGH